MKYILLITLVLSPLFAKLNVQTSYVSFEKIAKRIGGSHVKVKALANPHFDPHFIVPKPSLMARLRRADILIINGAGLELGWLPPLLKNANNGKIRPGSKGFLDLSKSIHLIEKPTSVSRAFGDVHAQGNPHYMLDPHNVINVAKAIAYKFSQVDEEHAKDYEQNLKKFEKHWREYLRKLDAKMTQCKEKKVVQYHMLFDYFLNAYGYKSYGNIEPLPGVSPSSKHTLALINTIRGKKVNMILQDVYHERKTAKFISAESGAKAVVLPHDVRAVDEADTLENFYNTIASRICR